MLIITISQLFNLRTNPTWSQLVSIWRQCWIWFGNSMFYINIVQKTPISIFSIQRYWKMFPSAYIVFCGGTFKNNEANINLFFNVFENCGWYQNHVLWKILTGKLFDHGSLIKRFFWKRSLISYFWSNLIFNFFLAKCWALIFFPRKSFI